VSVLDKKIKNRFGDYYLTLGYFLQHVVPGFIDTMDDLTRSLQRARLY
jgi:hypothetical protein